LLLFCWQSEAHSRIAGNLSRNRCPLRLRGNSPRNNWYLSAGRSGPVSVLLSVMAITIFTAIPDLTSQEILLAIQNVDVLIGASPPTGNRI